MSFENWTPSEAALAHGRHGELPFFTVKEFGFIVYEQGAHVTSWQRPSGDPVLFMSGSSLFEPGKPIRGGIPLVFPWFGLKEGQPELPAHGFARNRAWFLEGYSQEGEDHILEFSLRSDSSTKLNWPVEFVARYRMSVGPDRLKFRFSVHCAAPIPVEFEAVLHTYFVVKDVREIEIEGVEGGSYIDKLCAGDQRQEGRIRFTEETDRVYNASSGHFVIHDPLLKRRILIDTDAPSTVVWNPWIDKSRRLPDFGDDEWPGMVCVESGVIGSDQKELGGGEEFSFEVTYRVEDM